MITIPKILAPVLDLAARDTSRFSMTAARVQEYAGDRFRLDVTDGHAAAVVQGTARSKDAPALDGFPDLGVDYLVPLEPLRQCLRQTGKGGSAGVLFDGDKLLIATGSSVTRCQPVEGRFPPLDAVLPTRLPLLQVRVNALLLAAVLKAAAAFNEEDCHAVDLLIYHPNKPLGIATASPDGLTFDAVLMPLVAKK